MNCNNVRTLIEESDRPGNIPFEAARHAEGCESCSRFADERIKLAELLNSTGRVTAPPDFNMVLRRRLRERASVPSVSFWQRQAFALRTAGALAVLLCSVFLAQWMRHNASPTTTRPGSLAIENPLVNPGVTQIPTQIPQVKEPRIDVGLRAPSHEPVDSRTGRLVHFTHAHRFINSVGNNELAVAPAVDRELQDPRVAATLMVKNQSTERDLAVQWITVGAQPVVTSNPGSNNLITRF